MSECLKALASLLPYSLTCRILDGQWIEKPKVLKVASWIGGANKNAKDSDDESDKTTYGMERILKL